MDRPIPICRPLARNGAPFRPRPEAADLRADRRDCRGAHVQPAGGNWRRAQLVAWDAAQVGPELVVSAWPEPPSGRPAEPSAGAIAEAITERKRATETGVDPSKNTP